MQFDVKENDKGFLIPFYLEQMEEIERFFVIKNKNPNDVRGNHAHRKDSQILFLLSGECELNIENSEEKIDKKMKFGVPHYSRPNEWLKINMIKKDTVILVLSKEKYDEKEYIRDYEEFKKILRSENGKKN